MPLLRNAFEKCLSHFPSVRYNRIRSTSSAGVSVALKMVEQHSSGPRQRILLPEVASHCLSLCMTQVCSSIPMLLGSLQSLFINLM